MTNREQSLPNDPVAFIQDCVRHRRILWTYHVNMRLRARYIPRISIVNAVDTFQLIEANPGDQYLPSYLVLGRTEGDQFHVLFGLDTESDNVRVITAYRPNRDEWDDDLRERRQKT